MVTNAISQPERRFSIKAKKFFAERLHESPFGEHVAVDTQRRILLNLTIGKVATGEWRYHLGMLEQDIVFYLKNEYLSTLAEPAAYQTLSHEQRNAGEISIPLVICELKASSPNTHSFITYSSIAQQVRAVNPHCAYYFVIGEQSRRIRNETILRQAKGFDRVFLNWSEDKTNIWVDILGHFTYLRDRANIIPPGAY